MTTEPPVVKQQAAEAEVAPQPAVEVPAKACLQLVLAWDKLEFGGKLLSYDQLRPGRDRQMSCGVRCRQWRAVHRPVTSAMTGSGCECTL